MKNKPLLEEDYIGKTYNNLEILKFTERDKNHHMRCLVKCVCGKEFETLLLSLKSGNTKSCGCKKPERNKPFPIKHGFSRSRIYKIYHHIMNRCYNKNDDNYKNYGGRGIKVCDEWKNDILSFINWALNNGYEDNLSIDRIDVDGDYSPENCRWVNNHIQCANKRILKRNTSGYTGVTWSIVYNKWQSQISVNKNNFTLGRFDDKKEACIARDKFIKENNLREYKLQILTWEDK